MVEFAIDETRCKNDKLNAYYKSFVATKLKAEKLQQQERQHERRKKGKGDDDDDEDLLYDDDGVDDKAVRHATC